jgi:hypothetical protein
MVQSLAHRNLKTKEILEEQEMLNQTIVTLIIEASLLKMLLRNYSFLFGTGSRTITRHVVV